MMIIPDARGEPLLYESFPSGTIDSDRWRLQPACSMCGDQYTSKAELVNIGGTDYAFLSRGPDSWWETGGHADQGFPHANRWHNYILGRDMFIRGNGLACSVTVWGDPNNPAWTVVGPPSGLAAFPSNAGVQGPWRRVDGDSFAGLAYEQMEAGVGIIHGGFYRFEQTHSFGGPNALSQDFTDAFHATSHKANAITVRVEFGDNNGAMMQWKSANKGTYITEIDNRDDGTIPSQSDVWVGFASDLGAVLYDDILVVNDNNVGEIPTPTFGPSPTPGIPTPTPIPLWKRILPVGERYDATVPDTLDLAERAKLSVNCLTGDVDPDNGYLVIFDFNFSQHPPVGSVPSGLYPKNVHALPALRAMCGSEQNLDIEWEMMQRTSGVIWTINDYWRELDESYLDRFRAEEAGYTYDSDPTVIHVDGRAFTPPESALVGNDWIYIGGCDPQPFPYNPPEEPTKDQQGCEGIVKWFQITRMRGFRAYYELTEDPRALDFLRQYTRFIMKPDLWEDTGDPNFPGNEHGIWGGAWFGNMEVLQTLLEVAELENDDNLLRIVKEGFEYAKQRSVPTIGYHPSWIDPALYLRHPNSVHEYGASGTGATVILAVKLADAGFGEIWEDVDIWTRRMAEEQWIEEDVMLAAAGGDPESDAFIRRFVGGWGNGGLISRQFRIFGGGVSTETALALYYTWHGITRFAGGVATVNLFMNRASAWMDVDSYVPYEGKVVLHNKKARKVRVRIPDYVDIAQVERFVNDVQVQPDGQEGRYLIINNLSAGDEIRLEFPLVDEIHNLDINGRNYTITRRGNTVIDITPRIIEPAEIMSFPHQYEFYQNDYSDPVTPMITVERFVSDRLIPLCTPLKIKTTNSLWTVH